MPPKSAPWINLTPDRPGLDAQSRGAINEWCGVVGKQEKHRRHHKRNIQFPSRAVNWKTQRRSKALARETSNASSSTGGSRSTTGTPKFSGGPKIKDNGSSQSTPLTKSSPKSEVDDEKKNWFLVPESRQSSEEQDLQSPPTLFWKDGSMGVRVDPFDCISGTLDDPRQGEILDYYMQILDPGVVTTFFVFNMRSTYGTIPLEFLMDEEFRPLGLASIAGTMTSVKHAAINREYVLTQMGKGMRQLRRRLDRPQEANSDIILISVMFLAATAYVTGDLEGFDVHRKSLKLLVGLRGGLDQLGYGGGVKTVLLQWDAAWKLSTGRSIWIDKRPRNYPVYPKIPLDRSTLALVERIPVGFRKVCSRGAICLELIHALVRMTTAMSYKSARTIPYDQKIGQYDDYLAISSLQILIHDEDEGEDGDVSHMLEALLSLGLILFSSTAFNDMRATPVLFRGPKDALYKHLVRPVSEAPEMYHGSYSMCYQWVWAVTVDAWRDASRELMPQGRYLLGQFHDRYSSNWDTSDDLVDILKRFFWTDDLIKFHRQSFEIYRATNPRNASPLPT